MMRPFRFAVQLSAAPDGKAWRAQARQVEDLGTIDQICETLRARRAEFGFSYWVVHEADIAAFAPVVNRLAGE